MIDYGQFGLLRGSCARQRLEYPALIALIISSVAALFNGCGSIPAFTHRNDIYDRSAKSVNRANLKQWDNQANVFVGVAISGGGSRAANFSAAVLEELEKQGFMKHVNAMSSVSGGSLTAAYFALYRQSPSWTWSEFYSKLREDLEDKAWCRFLYCMPVSLWNLLRGGLTHYDRSNLMAGVFDDVFFDTKTFGDLNDDPKGPKLLINATALTTGDSTPFLDSYFSDNFYSRLDKFPISQAVMASGAFPGAFPSVTLKNYGSLSYEIVDADSLFRKIQKLETLGDPEFTRIQQTALFSTVSQMASSYLSVPHTQVLPESQAQDALTLLTQILLESKSRFETRQVLEGWFGSTIQLHSLYEHLFDGGPADNWGLDTLTKAAEEHSRATKDWGGCFIFLIDAYPETSTRDKMYEPDTRQEFSDFLIDSNALDASDVLFRKERLRMQERFETPYSEDSLKGRFLKLNIDKGSNHSCQVWHIMFDRFRYRPDYDNWQYSRLTTWAAVPHAAPRIKTRYRLTGLENCSARQHQDILRAAAWLLINRDFDIARPLEEARAWFQRRSLNLESSSPVKEFDIPNIIVEPTSQGKRVYCNS